jgi:NAD(P)-dependent dehydrogenase (short-subunit alcohol dehydrogenase family)
VTAHDLQPDDAQARSDVFCVQGDISDEASIASCIKQAHDHFGPINILCANAGITNEASHPNIWELPLETWENVYRVNIRGTFLTIKHFLLAAKATQENLGRARPDMLNMPLEKLACNTDSCLLSRTRSCDLTGKRGSMLLRQDG